MNTQQRSYLRQVGMIWLLVWGAWVGLIIVYGGAWLVAVIPAIVSAAFIAWRCWQLRTGGKL